MKKSRARLLRLYHQLKTYFVSRLFEVENITNKFFWCRKTTFKLDSSHSKDSDHFRSGIWVFLIWKQPDIPNLNSAQNLGNFSFGRFEQLCLCLIEQIFHPNIQEDGTILIDILTDNWSPALTIETLMLSICSILSNPEPDESSINEASRMYLDHWLNYTKIAREWTKQYAMGNPPPP